eukprot:11955661-Prorocentrum_lima.AAC.1
MFGVTPNQKTDWPPGQSGGASTPNGSGTMPSGAAVGKSLDVRRKDHAQGHGGDAAHHPQDPFGADRKGVALT